MSAIHLYVSDMVIKGEMVMDIRNCKKCGTIYNYILGPNLCPKCMKDLEEKYHDVKQYIYDHPGVGVVEVSEAMEVSIGQIRQWVKEERLQFAEGSVTDITCESCGKTILSGRFCTHCKEAMVRELGSVYRVYQKEEKNPKDHKGEKMRFLKWRDDARDK